MSRVIAAGMAAAASWWLAAALSIPVWRHWPAGDRCDIAGAVFFAVLLSQARRP